MLHVVHHPAYVSPATDGQQARFDKYGLVMDVLADSGAPMTVHAPDPMPASWIAAVHDPAYVEQVLALAVPLEKERRIGFPVTEWVMRRALLSPGGTWLAAKLALVHGYAANAAGGQPSCAGRQRRGLLRVQRSGDRGQPADRGGGC